MEETGAHSDPGALLASVEKLDKAIKEKEKAAKDKKKEERRKKRGMKSLRGRKSKALEGPQPPKKPIDEHTPYLPVVDLRHPRQNRRPRRHNQTATNVHFPHTGKEERCVERTPEAPLRHSTRATRYANGCIAGGGYHTAAIDEHGVLYTWGMGANGQVGHGPEPHRYGRLEDPTFDEREPKPVAGFSGEYRAVQVSCGVQHTAVVGEDGVLWTFGAVGAKLGQGQDTRDTMEKITACYLPQPVVTRFGVMVKQVACGWSHTAFVTETGSLWTWGVGKQGRHGHGHTLDVFDAALVASVKQVKFQCVQAGAAHTVAISEEGRVYTAGRGIACGEFQQYVPLPGRKGSDAKEDEQNWQPADRHPMRVVEALVEAGVVAAHCAAGAGHTGIVTDEGHVWTWGWNAYGQLGLGGRKDKLVPQQVELYGLQVNRIAFGAYHSLLVTKNGELISFGAGGPDPEEEDDAELIKTDGMSKSAPGGERGRLCQCADEQSSDSDSDGEYYPVVESNGDRLLPRFVQGPWKARVYPRVAHIAAGAYHSMFITEGGELFIAGVGKYGRLGLGHQAPAYTPAIISWFERRGIYFPTAVASESLHQHADERLRKHLTAIKLLAIANHVEEEEAPPPDPATLALEGEGAGAEGEQSTELAVVPEYDSFSSDSD